jgi:hypothetical protein
MQVDPLSEKICQLKYQSGPRQKLGEILTHTLKKCRGKSQRWDKEKTFD